MIARLNSKTTAKSASVSEASTYDGIDDDMRRFFSGGSYMPSERFRASDNLARSYDLIPENRRDEFVRVIGDNIELAAIFANSLMTLNRDVFRNQKHKHLTLALLPAMDGKTQLSVIRVAGKYLDPSKKEKAFLAHHALENLVRVSGNNLISKDDPRRALAYDVVAKTASNLRNKEDKNKFNLLKSLDKDFAFHLKNITSFLGNEIPSAPMKPFLPERDDTPAASYDGTPQSIREHDPLAVFLRDLNANATTPKQRRKTITAARDSYGR